MTTAWVWAAAWREHLVYYTVVRTLVTVLCLVSEWASRNCRPLARLEGSEGSDDGQARGLWRTYGDGPNNIKDLPAEGTS